MATYTLRNKETDAVEDFTMKISEYDEFMESHPELERYWGNASSGPPQGDPIRLGITRNSEGFNDVLRMVKRNNRNFFQGGTNINVSR